MTTPLQKSDFKKSLKTTCLLIPSVIKMEFNQEKGLIFQICLAAIK
jgi:hypothetical protein